MTISQGHLGFEPRSIYLWKSSLVDHTPVSISCLLPSSQNSPGQLGLQPWLPGSEVASSWVSKSPGLQGSFFRRLQNCPIPPSWILESSWESRLRPLELKGDLQMTGSANSCFTAEEMAWTDDISCLKLQSVCGRCGARTEESWLPAWGFREIDR